MQAQYIILLQKSKIFYFNLGINTVLTKFLLNFKLLPGNVS